MRRTIAILIASFGIAFSTGYVFRPGPVEHRGCCSHHGGVCGCNGGSALCCDKTISPTCDCS